jgi:DNA-binding transcriptional regulator/RsmH inhibitor MraZ
MIDQ